MHRRLRMFKSDSTKKLTLAATGDILLHKNVMKNARKIFSYDFTSNFSEVKPLFDHADLAIVNQESIIAGKEFGLSSYPKFNSPVEIGYTLKDLGVDIVNIANNHVLDKGEKGLLKSIENWKEIGLPYVGAYESFEDQQKIRVIEKKGLKVCFLSYTRKTNNAKIPKDKAYLVNKYKPQKLLKLKKYINKIRSQKIADVIVVSLHFGEEYHLYPTAEQREVSASLSDAGADIIIGHHPHVLQPAEWILNSRGKKTFVIYSLGNFYSGQQGLYRQIGAFFTIDIEKNSNNSNVRIYNPTLKLTYIDSCDKKDFKLRLYEDVVKGQDYIKTNEGSFNTFETYEEIKTRLSKWLNDLNIS